MFLSVNIIWSATQSEKLLQYLITTGFYAPSVLQEEGTPSIPEPIYYYFGTSRSYECYIIRK